MAITDPTQIISIKDGYIRDYLVGLFSGSISAAVESPAGTWTLTITFDQTNTVQSSNPALAVNDPITIYDSLVYPTGVFFKQYTISSVNSDTEIEIETTDTITDAYSWRLFAGHTQTGNPRAFHIIDEPKESKSIAPIICVNGVKNIYNQKDKTSACVQGFLTIIDFVCTVEVFQADKKWSSAATALTKQFCDTKSYIAKQNLDYREIHEDIHSRFDHYFSPQEAYGNKFFVEIDNNRLIRP